MSHALSSMPTVIAASAPVESHCARSWPIPNAPMMSGIATLTVVVVSTAEMVPSMTVTVANHRYRDPYRCERTSVVSDRNVDFRHHPRAQHEVLLGELDPHRQALRDLGEIAARIRVRQQSELARGRLADAMDLAMEYTAGIRVDTHVGFHAGLQRADCGFLHVRL